MKEAKTRTMFCYCTSKYQDARYGMGLRLHNKCTKQMPGQQNWRCTVCGKRK